VKREGKSKSARKFPLTHGFEKNRTPTYIKKKRKKIMKMKKNEKVLK